MIEFIEKHKRLLAGYCTVLRIFGWIFLGLGGIGIALLVIESTQTGGAVDVRGALGFIKRSNTANISMGLVSLGFAQLVRYLCGNDRKMGLLLRFGEKIFYFCAIIVIWNIGVLIWIKANGLFGGNSPLYSYLLLYFLPILLYKTAKILILVGLGQFLKHFVAAIEPSKLKIQG